MLTGGHGAEQYSRVLPDTQHLRSYHPGISREFPSGPNGGARIEFAVAAEELGADPARAYAGKSSVEYLSGEDKAKPRVQQYKISADMVLT